VFLKQSIKMQKEGHYEMKDRRLRILVNTNGFWSTSGYGSQALHWLNALKADGWEVAISAFYGLEGGIIELNGIKCYPKIGSMWGEDAMIEHAKDFKADIVISLQDIWVLNPNLLQHIPRWIPYVPIDHDPIPDEIAARLKQAYRIVSYSKFGEEQIAKVGLHSRYIPHMVDVNIFKPLDKATVRKALGIPEDVFLFGMVAANKDNPPRKSFQEAMDAFKLFQAKHPKSAMFFHVQVQQQGGFDIIRYAKRIGIEKYIYHMPPYELLYKVDREGMAKIYSMMDCLLMPSTNEGFGVPAVEAQACGVPVIVNNFTSMPELIIPGRTGYACDVLYKRFTPLGSYVGVPSTQSIYEKMELIFDSDREQMAKDAREHVTKNYSLEVVMPMWISFLERVQKEIYPNPIDNTEKKA
jgi:glycosyltransferase involved in cell wall biosynthesis